MSDEVKMVVSFHRTSPPFLGWWPPGFPPSPGGQAMGEVLPTDSLLTACGVAIPWAFFLSIGIEMSNASTVDPFLLSRWR